MSCVFSVAKLKYCLRKGYLSRSAYAVASAKVAARISLLDVMWSRFWFRRGRRRKEGGNLLKRGALCHDVIGSHDELMETIKK